MRWYKLPRTSRKGGFDKAKQTANAVLDAAYGYNMGAVLFKPTLTVAPQTFRTTKEGALAYFVGGDKNYASDTGFALKGWRKVEVKNSGIQLHGNTAMSMGNVSMTDKKRQGHHGRQNLGLCEGRQRHAPHRSAPFFFAL